MSCYWCSGRPAVSPDQTSRTAAQFGRSLKAPQPIDVCVPQLLEHVEETKELCLFSRLL